MAIKFHNPKTVSLAGKYSLGAEVPQGARLLYVSGQVGVDSRGKLQAGIDKQVEQVWKNIAQVLKSGGMGLGDIVKVTTFLTDSRFIVPYRTVRDRFFADAALSGLDPADRGRPRRSRHAGRDRGGGGEVRARERAVELCSQIA